MTMPQQSTSNTEWHRPFWLIAGVIIVIVLLMLLLDMGPETTLVAAFGAFLGATVWCVTSLSQAPLIAKPPPRAVAPPRTVGADQRVKALRTGILFGRALGGHSDHLQQTLLEVIDDQLMHSHGIDRSNDPEAAASIIGPKLTAFVNDPEAAASIADTKQLTRIVTLIEQI